MKAKLNKIAIKKKKSVRKRILEAIDILLKVHVPLNDLTPRRLEKMAMTFMAVAGINIKNSWTQCQSIENSRFLRTREIISYINDNFEENISFGSYDDIRRKDLVLLVGMCLIIKSAKNPNADTNDGTRGYAVNSEFAELIQSYKTKEWKDNLSKFPIDEEYIQLFTSKRTHKKIEVCLSKDVKISLDSGSHNEIQKAIIEDFLPRFGHGAIVLYMGDTSNKLIRKYDKAMIEIGLDIKDRGMLPDIVAFSKNKHWLFLIEAVHSSNPFNPERCIELKRSVLRECPYDVVYVTAFLNRKEFAKWLPQIAWETEVWLVDNPDHMIHFNGDKFLGPHLQKHES